MGEDQSFAHQIDVGWSQWRILSLESAMVMAEVCHLFIVFPINIQRPCLWMFNLYIFSFLKEAYHFCEHLILFGFGVFLWLMAYQSFSAPNYLLCYWQQRRSKLEKRLPWSEFFFSTIANMSVQILLFAFGFCFFGWLVVFFLITIVFHLCSALNIWLFKITF